MLLLLSEGLPGYLHQLGGQVVIKMEPLTEP
jgi:hypothetical protein